MPSASPSEPTPAPNARAIRRVAILFAGGPAPAANAVISTAAASFRRNGIEVLGILHGYAHLVELRRRPPDAGRARLHRPGPDQPAADAEHPRHLDRHVADQPRQGRLAAQPPRRSRAHRPAPRRSIGHSPRWASTPWSRSAATTRSRPPTSSSGSRTTCPPGEPRIAVVHVPKTIDNDYRGIDFTFGYFTAVETLAERDPQPPGRRRGGPDRTSSSRPWAAAPAGWPTGPPSPARPAWSSASRTSTTTLMTEETAHRPQDRHDDARARS